MVNPAGNAFFPLPGGCVSDRAYGLGLFLVGVYLSIKTPLINKYALSKYVNRNMRCFPSSISVSADFTHIQHQFSQV